MVIFDRIIRSIQKTGGASILFNELVSRMKRDGIPYAEFGYDDKEASRSNYTLAPRRILERYRDAVLPRNIKFGKNDIFHSTCYRLPGNKGGKIVTTVHDFTYEILIKGVPALVHSWQKNRAVRASDLVICVSENTKKDLLQFMPDVDENKVVVVHNGASSGFFPIPGAHVKPYVLYVGQRAAYKNFNALVLAMKDLPELELACIGGGAFTSQEIKFMDSILGGRYRHFGYVSEAGLNVAYNEAFCFVYPSLYEGFGIPVIESMMAGCPVIALNRSSIPEVAGNAAILLDDGHPSEIAAAIKAFHNSAIRTRCIDDGLVWATRFSWEACYSGTMKVYRKMGVL